MTRIFDGTFKNLESRLLNIGIFGKWETRPHGVWQLKTRCGCTLSWSNTQRTFWAQGTAEKVESLDKLLAAHFDEDTRAYHLAVVGNEDTMPYDQLISMLNAAGLDAILVGRA